MEIRLLLTSIVKITISFRIYVWNSFLVSVIFFDRIFYLYILNYY